MLTSCKNGQFVNSAAPEPMQHHKIASFQVLPANATLGADEQYAKISQSLNTALPAALAGQGVLPPANLVVTVNSIRVDLDAGNFVAGLLGSKSNNELQTTVLLVDPVTGTPLGQYNQRVNVTSDKAREGLKIYNPSDWSMSGFRDRKFNALADTYTNDLVRNLYPSR